MNAYELADKLILPDCFREYIIDSVIMLRQQADRIAELEKEKDYIKEEWVSGFTKIAIMERTQELYTHPVKQLSDEEIDRLMEFAGIRPSKEWGLATTGNVQLRKFARAIIKEITE